ncbi:MAG: hypothetical protein K2X73_04565 [Sphingomonas sp.]|uniref:hypothetical protein n=1 Tax=Sphingomonas sp. TaxID=28214 RepID=UPI0025F81C21|nr:hypothetical protein [Sphingomonas sp.]MBX9881227.1 hypothetical protein [Sphingomonas sp.]
MIRLLMLCLALLAGAPAIAQTPPDYRAGGATTSTNPLPVQLRCWNGSAYQPCTFSGGGGDPSSTGTTGSAPPDNASVVAGWDGTLLRRLFTDDTGRLWVNLNGSIPTGANVIGGVNQAGTWTVGLSGFAIVSSGSGTGAVLKASGGALISLNVAAGAAGYAVVYDATAVPADGALTPSLVRYCVYLNAGDVLRDPIGAPITLSSGGVFFVSSAGCTSKTAVSYSFLAAQVR